MSYGSQGARGKGDEGMKLVSTGGRGPVLALLALSVLLSFCASSSVLARPTLPYCYATVSVPWDPNQPGCPCPGQTQVMSGTACAALACVGAAEGCYVETVLLHVAGVEVNSYHRQQGEFYRTYKIGAMWSSTHFPSDSDVQVVVQVVDSQSHYANDVHYAVAKNRAYVLANDTEGNCGGNLGWSEEAAAHVLSHCRAMNHLAPDTRLCDLSSQILGAIPVYSVFYICAHGASCEQFQDCVPEYHPEWDHSLLSTEVAAAVSNKTCTQPRYNVAQVDACNSADIYGELCCTMQQAFDAEAYVGWTTGYLNSPRNSDWTGYVWGYLDDGHTIGEAVYLAMCDYHPDEDSVGDHAAYPGLCGDGQVTLRTVYGGSPGQWYRPNINEGSPG
jgi:hypothetical protein